VTFVLTLVSGSRAADPAADTQWPGFNGGYDATRFSPLTQVDTTNVDTLREVARFRLLETLSFQSEPVVIGDTIYVRTRERRGRGRNEQPHRPNREQAGVGRDIHPLERLNSA
jgi:hypothetical protein